MPAVYNLPRMSQGQDPVAYTDTLCKTLEDMLRRLASPSGIYTVTHVTDSRTLDATAATLAELRQVVGTMIEDLQTKGTFAS